MADHLIGVSGLLINFYKGVVATVDKTLPNTPADGKFKSGQIITGVNGVEFIGRNAIVILGEALTKAEATDGALVFDVKDTAQAPDQAAHSSLSWVTQKEGAFLYGMTDKPAAGLLPMAKAWIHPAALRTIGPAFSSDGYNQDQRAYLLKRVQTADSLEIELAGSPESPVYNLPLVIEGWGDRDVAAKLNGTDVPRGANFRFGHRRTLDGTDLIVWVKALAEKPVKLSLMAVK